MKLFENVKIDPTGYKLVNVRTGRIFEDEGWTLADPEDSSPSLVRAVYDQKKFNPRDDLRGIYRYADWMPVKRILRKSAAPVTYKSKGLANWLGLNNLYITFSGWNPKIGARMQHTCENGQEGKQGPYCTVCRQYGEGLCPGMFRQ